MNESDLLPDVLKTIATWLPCFLVFLFGCILVIVRWRSLGNAAWPAICGLGLALLLSEAVPLFWTVVPRLMSNHPGLRSSLSMIISIATSILWAIVYVLVSLAIVLGRSDKPDPAATNNSG
jgi:hypothetical protein